MYLLNFGKFIKTCHSDPEVSGEESCFPHPRCFDRLSMTPLHSNNIKVCQSSVKFIYVTLQVTFLCIERKDYE